MSILVTGGTGSVGYHLLQLLPKERGPLVSASLNGARPGRTRKDVVYAQVDLRDARQAHALFETYRPVEVYHLAGQNSVSLGEKHPLDTLVGNVQATFNVLEACRRYTPEARVLVQSSCEIYGLGAADRGLEDPRVESDPCAPVSVLGSSKSSCEVVARQFHLAYGMDVFWVRHFNFLGPFQSRRFLIPALAAQIARIHLRKGEPLLYTGDLDLSRDYVDTRDLVRCYVLLMARARAGEAYNACSGVVRSLRELVEELIELSGLRLELRFDPTRERRNEIPMQAGSPEKTASITGWRPVIALQDSLRDLYHEIHGRVAAELKGTK